MNRLSFYFLRFTFLSFFLFGASFATGVDWRIYNIQLRKDEVFQGTLERNQLESKFSFRWTLLKDSGVVVLLKYDGFFHQFILYPDRLLNRFKLPLGAKDLFYEDYLILVLDSIQNQEVHFKLLLTRDVNFTSG